MPGGGGLQLAEPSTKGRDVVQGAVHGESGPMMLGPRVLPKAASKSAAVL